MERNRTTGETKPEAKSPVNPLVFIGVDPGVSGAVAFIFADGDCSVYDFNDRGALAALQRTAVSYKCIAAIERVSSMPGQGVASTFKFGVNFGQWIGRFEALGIQFEFVSPRRWRSTVQDCAPSSGDIKQDSIDRACRYFPALQHRLTRRAHHNRAEALLIAEYIRRSHAQRKGSDALGGGLCKSRSTT